MAPFFTSARALTGTERGHQSLSGLLRRAWFYPTRRADLHAGGMRRHHYVVSGRLFWRHGLPHPEWTALYGSWSHGLWQSLLLRPNLPGGEIQDPSSPHRVLDDRTRGGLLRSQRRYG